MTNFEKVARYVMGDDDSELGKIKAERDYALHCLEREIGLCAEANLEIGRLRTALETVENYSNDPAIIKMVRFALEQTPVSLSDVGGEKL